ncbi:MAG: HAD-IIA family hydrolase [Mycobacteriaceae bacterium]
MRSLRSGFDVLLLDLDGTVYQGAKPIPGALAALEGSPQSLFYVTNNASRSPAEVAKHLSELGFKASINEVVTSAQSAARLVSELLPSGSKILVVGTEALAEELRLVGLEPVRSFSERPVGVVQGHSPETNWGILAEAALSIRAGALWVTANRDTTLPTDRGLLPGNGSMVAALCAATSSEPLVAGKPATPLMIDALTRSKAQSALVIGDRLDTDIEGANAVKLPSLLVLTGVSTAREVIFAQPQLRPTFIGADMLALNAATDSLRVHKSLHWHVDIDRSHVHVRSNVDSNPEDASIVCALAATVWAQQSPEFSGQSFVPLDELAARALSKWSL